LTPEIEQRVEEGSVIFTDALHSYQNPAAMYTHLMIDHAEAYAQGLVHTNRMENFWSLLKRGIKGTYVSVEPFHLFRCLDEQSFRFNNRKLTDAERFVISMNHIGGRRLTYKQFGRQGGTDSWSHLWMTSGPLHRQGRGKHIPRQTA